MKKLFLIATSCALATSVFALTASGNADNYGSGWTSGTNGGSGFNPWGFTTTADNTVYINNSAPGGSSINTTAGSFEMAANNGGSFDVFRSFGGGASLAAGDIFSVDISVNFRNGNKGFDLRNDGTGLFNFNVGGDNYFFGGTDLGAERWGYVTDGVYSLEFEFLTETIMNAKITRTSLTDITREFELTNVNLSSAVNNFKFYVSGSDNADAVNRLYANNLEVVPEPSTYALFAGAFVLMFAMQRRRR